jgi:hypothetical protein
MHGLYVPFGTPARERSALRNSSASISVVPPTRGRKPYGYVVQRFYQLFKTAVELTIKMHM